MPWIDWLLYLTQRGLIILLDQSGQMYSQKLNVPAYLLIRYNNRLFVRLSHLSVN